MAIGQLLTYCKKQHPGHTLCTKFDSTSNVPLADNLLHTPPASYRKYLTIVTMYKLVIRPGQHTAPKHYVKGIN